MFALRALRKQLLFYGQRLSCVPSPSPSVCSMQFAFTSPKMSGLTLPVMPSGYPGNLAVRAGMSHCHDCHQFVNSVFNPQNSVVRTEVSAGHSDEKSDSALGF